LALTLASCSNPNGAAPVETSSTPTSTTSSSTSSSTTPTSTTSTSSTTTTSEPTSAELADNLSEPIPAPEPPPAAQTPNTPSSQNGSIINARIVGYQCTGTDAITVDPANCTPATLGGDPVYDQLEPVGYPASEVPFADGGTCA